MPLGFGHLIGAWGFGKIFCKITGKRLNKFAWAMLLLGGNLPDIDYLIDWTTCFKIHRYFSHSITTAVLIGIIAYLFLFAFNSIFKKYKVQKIGIAAIMLTAGIIVHIALDLLFTTAGMRVLWPFENSWWTINGTTEYTTKMPTYEELKQNLNNATMDIALGVALIWYLFFRKKLKVD